ncbi:hypothetical protein DVH05_014425 [Phytophthora capsici]|nr:hypothetical protein DVH05_014425 [Phytophthora capsici]
MVYISSNNGTLCHLERERTKPHKQASPPVPLLQSCSSPAGSVWPQGARMASTKRSSVNGKGALDGAYKVFMKSTPVYVTTVLLATLVAEGIYGSATNYIWEAYVQDREIMKWIDTFWWC